MGISNFFKKTVSTTRLGNIGGSSKRQSWSANLTDISVAIHPQNSEQVSVLGSAFYNSYKMFCSKTLDILEGDRIVDGSTIYTVTGVSLFDDVGGRDNEHMRVLLVKGK